MIQMLSLLNLAFGWPMEGPSNAPSQSRMTPSTSHLDGYVEKGLPLILLSNSSRIESCTDSSAECCVIPTDVFKQMNLPVFDIDGDTIGSAGYESYDVIDGYFFTIEQPKHNQPTAYKTSNQLFSVCTYPVLSSNKTSHIFHVAINALFSASTP